MPYRNWADLERVNAVDFQNLIQDQVIATFNTTAERDAAITVPKVGQYAFVASNGTLYKWDGASWFDALESRLRLVPAQAGRQLLIGSATVNISQGNNGGSQSVPFSPAFFSAPHVLVSSKQGASGVRVIVGSATSITSTGFALHARTGDAEPVAVADSYNFDWVAIGIP